MLIFYFFSFVSLSVMSLDAMDASGGHQLDLSHNVKKVSLDARGKILSLELDHEITPGS